MDDREIMRTVLLKMIRLSHAELRQFNADAAKLPLEDDVKEWLRSIARELINIDLKVEDNLRIHARKGFMKGLFDSNEDELGPLSKADLDKL